MKREGVIFLFEKDFAGKKAVFLGGVATAHRAISTPSNLQEVEVITSENEFLCAGYETSGHD